MVYYLEYMNIIQNFKREYNVPRCYPLSLCKSPSSQSHHCAYWFHLFLLYSFCQSCPLGVLWEFVLYICTPQVCFWSTQMESYVINYCLVLFICYHTCNSILPMCVFTTRSLFVVTNSSLQYRCALRSHLV